MKRSLLLVALLAGISYCTATWAADQATSQSDQLEEIVLTGSRVITNGNDSPTPVTVVPVEQIMQLQPTTLAEALNTLPQFQGSQTSTSGPGSGIRNGSAAYITLRNAGDNHTLVLYDGHRVLPAAPQESHASDVDVNLIPQILLERVDVVTGGASAVYGSDAVVGVVNFITDTKFNGIKLESSVGESTYEDDRTETVSLAAGHSLFAGRAHGEFSYEYRNDPGILDFQDKLKRPFFAAGYGGGGAGTATSPYYLVANERLSSTSFGGLIKSGPLNGLNFTQNGVLSPFTHGTATGNSSIEGGGDGAWYEDASIKSSLRQHKLFGRVDVDVTDSTHAYAQYGWTTEQSQNVYRTNILSLNVGYNNPYLNSIQSTYQPSIAAQLAANPLGTFSFSKMFLNGDTAPIYNKMNFGMLLGGLDGKIGSYKWELSFGHEWANSDIENPANIDMGHLLAASNAVVNPSNPGQIVCHAALTNPNYSNCVPLNLFGPSSESNAALGYVLADTKANTYTKLDEFEASVTGSPVSTWAGPINMALSGDWHRTGYDLMSYAQPADLVDCTGIQFSCTQGKTTRWAANTLTSLEPGVSVTTSEAAYEADIPLLKDRSLAQALNLNAAVRYTDYSTSGSVWTWKLGLNWRLNDEWHFRLTRSRDIRAPNLYELYSPPAVNVASFLDIHTNTSGTVSRVQYSDPTLQPEKADTLTGGFVWEPTFLQGFSFTVDAYRIKINNAIYQVSSQTLQIEQACEASNGTSPYCAWYIRPLPFSNRTAANFPTQLLAYVQNIAGQDTYGADFEANYSTRLFGRALTLRGLLSFQPHNIFSVGPLGTFDVGGSAQVPPVGNVYTTPHLRGNLIAKYDLTDNFNFSIMERWRSGMRASNDPTQFYVDNWIPSIAYTNVTLTYAFNTDLGRTETYFNVQNLFNKFPSVPAGGPPNSLPGASLSGLNAAVLIGDDPIGRYYMIGFRLRR
jgi:outer membrane receptor protein involved in Fe transport